MKRNNVLEQPLARKQLGALTVPLLLGFGLAAGACSVDDSASPAAAATTLPASTSTVPSEASSTTEPPPTTSSSNGDVGAFLDELETLGFDGVVAVRDGADTTTHSYGLADRENAVPVDDDTVFDIGSITKPFTAAAILRLEMDGRLSVNDTLGQHVPGLPADKAAITLHQLLTHTSGLPRDLGPDDEPIGRSDYLALAGATPFVFEPGDQYAYSNLGYSLLTAVIEFETGEPYETYLRTALFEPAGMLDTGYVLPDWGGHTIAVGYHDSSGERFGRPNEQPWDVDGPYWHLRGNGGLLSTAADMLRWDEALRTDDVLDATAKAKYFTPQAPLGPDQDAHYSYGWVVVDTPVGTPFITHNGGNGVFYADFLWLPDQDVTVFIASNSFRDEHNDVASGVADAVLGGGLEAMFGDDEAPNDDAAPVNCGFVGLTIDSLPSYPTLDTLPDSPAGRAAEEFVGLIAVGDSVARVDFATDHVAEEFGGDDPIAIADFIEGLQEDFFGFEVAAIFGQDEQHFHLVMNGPNNDLMLSLGFDDPGQDRVACLAVSP